MLSRWINSNEGIITPDKYMKDVESGMEIYWLTEQLIRDGVQVLKEIQATDKSCGLSFNLSSKIVADTRIINKITEYFNNASINHSTVTFEITESAYMYYPNIALKNIQKLFSLGFNISLDDFGTGYTSYSYIKNMKLNEIKIDKSFIHGIRDSKVNQTIVKNILHLSKELGLQSCAEGIETEDDYLFLKKMGCDIGQGFFWSKPIPYKEALKLI
ncbi:EAL domain-containing protein [Thiotrichales bacterium 19S3-7]|nr:EAL domain-containing protein [Thiotrichales bacterium 19S3-7]MCF6801311.1 EAL domain-containing protein [Thiotrichales bacterium 19S3-11]